MNGNFRVAAFAGALAILATLPAIAQQQDVVRIRGTIERVEGGNYVVKARDGTELKLAIAEKPQIAGVVKASLDDIKPGSSSGSPQCRSPMAACALSKCTSFPNPCAAPAKGTTPGTCARKAR